MTDVRFSDLPQVAAFLDALVFGCGNAGVSNKILGSQIRAAWGIDYLGSTVLLAGAPQTSIVTVAARDFLWTYHRVSGYGASPNPAGDIASVMFGGASGIDSGPNYWSRHAEFDNGIWQDTPFTAVSLIRLAASNSQKSRNVFCTINNRVNSTKTVNIKNQTGSGNASIVGALNLGGGEWVNTTDQILNIQMVTASGNNMGAGSGFAVFGRNF